MLSFSDNGQSMVIYPYGMNHAPLVVIVSWQRSEHGYISLRYEPCSVSCYHLVTTPEHGNISLRYEPCSVSCYRLMTTVRAWYYIPKVWNMLRQFSSWHDNGQSMVIHPLRYETCSVSCHRLKKTVRAWLFISKIWNMLRQLSSWHDNCQSMGFHP